MDEENKKFTLARQRHTTRATSISLDGSTGNIYDGIIPTVDASIAGEFGRIMAWADKYRTAESSHQRRYSGMTLRKRCELGAEGIGLCRTEHMFFEGDRIDCIPRDDLFRYC